MYTLYIHYIYIIYIHYIYIYIYKYIIEGRGKSPALQHFINCF